MCPGAVFGQGLLLFLIPFFYHCPYFFYGHSTNSFLFTYEKMISVNVLDAVEHLVPKAESWE